MDWYIDEKAFGIKSMGLVPLLAFWERYQWQHGELNTPLSFVFRLIWIWRQFWWLIVSSFHWCENLVPKLKWLPLITSHDIPSHFSSPSNVYHTVHIHIPIPIFDTNLIPNPVPIITDTHSFTHPPQASIKRNECVFLSNPHIWQKRKWGGRKDVTEPWLSNQLLQLLLISLFYKTRAGDIQLETVWMMVYVQRAGFENGSRHHHALCGGHMRTSGIFAVPE